MGEARGWFVAGAEHHVHVALLDRQEQPLDVSRRMLAVAVDANRGVIAGSRGVTKPCPHGAADAEAMREAQPLHAKLREKRRRRVCRAVVDDEQIEIRPLTSQL